MNQHILTIIRCLATLLVCLHINAFADIKSATQSWSQGDYESAVAEFKQLAESGNDKAQVNLGYMYYIGEGVLQDYEKALYWYRKAAIQSNKDAQYNIAVAYAFGDGVEQDLNEATVWYRRAAEQDHTLAQYSLGISYIYGEGVEQNQELAAQWFRKAAEKGYVKAQVYLGSMHHIGEGVEQDYTEAVRWYQMAADNGDATAQYNLGIMYRVGQGVEKSYEQAKHWLQQAANQNYDIAQDQLASMERTAVTPSKQQLFSIDKEDILTLNKEEDTATSDTEYEESSNIENTATTVQTDVIDDAIIDKNTEAVGFFTALKNLFYPKDNTDNIPPKSSESNIPLETTAQPTTDEVNTEIRTKIDTESPEYRFSAGLRALNNGDYDIAIRNFEPLAETGNAHAQLQLATLYYIGKGVDKNLDKALNWYRKSAEQGNEDAQYNMGNMYLLGDGIEQSDIEAAKWYGLASEQGHDLARHNLENLKKIEESLNQNNQQQADTNTNLNLTANVPEDTDTISSGPSQDAIDSGTQNTTVETEYEDPKNRDADTPEKLSSLNGLANTFSEQEETETQVATDIPQENETKTDTVEKPEELSETQTPSFFEKIFGLTPEQKTKIPDPETEVIEETESENTIAIVEPTETITLDQSNTNTAVGQENVTIDIASTANGQDDTDASTDKIDDLRIAATQGDHEAQYKIATRYYTGDGIQQDYLQAALWYHRAAEQGNAEAQYNLGNMYLMAEGIQQDEQQAAHWYTLAAAKNHRLAKQNLINLQNSIDSKELPKDNEFIQQDTVAVETKIDSDVDPTGRAEFEHGLAYILGDGVPRSDKNAFDLFLKAAKKGHTQAQYRVGNAYSYGKGTEQDYTKATEWYQNAAMQGHVIAQRDLAEIYLKVNDHDKIRAMAWYQIIVKNSGNSADVERRNLLRKELTETEFTQAQELKKQILSELQ